MIFLNNCSPMYIYLYLFYQSSLPPSHQPLDFLIVFFFFQNTNSIYVTINISINISFHLFIYIYISINLFPNTSITLLRYYFTKAFSQGRLFHLPQGGNFISGKFPNLKFPKGQPPKGQVRPCEAMMGSSAAARIGQGAERCGQDRLWKSPLWKFHIWEVPKLINILGKLTLGKKDFGKLPSIIIY